MLKTDEQFMRRAIELATKGKGMTSPNPIVGAVVVKNGKIVGEGYHKRAGTPHAEIVALRRAGIKAHGADLYVTLEPCCHYGRTPPCCDAIIASGIKRVIVGMRDPNPLVNGKGISFLKTKGIDVIQGVLEEEYGHLNKAYQKWIVSGIPYVTMKAALSLDGKIATTSGESKWITNEACRRYVHHLRSLHDAIVVGVNTVRHDNPELTVRLPGKDEKKLAVILDEKLDVPPSSKLFRRKPKQLIIATTSRAPKRRRAQFEKMGHQILLCRSTSRGYIFLPHLLLQLGAQGITSLMVEGGGEVFSDFFNRGLVDRIVACIAPKIIGGKGRDWLPNVSIEKLKSAPHLSDMDIKIFGDNVVIEGYMKK
jgi:diaminohydroxyphosphoribosylaminopyrimidine deaminase/5-amino-6-(5-phosphoribosylamino)uracil reductase